MSAADGKKEEALCGALNVVINEMAEEQFSHVVELANEHLRAWFNGEKVAISHKCVVLCCVGLLGANVVNGRVQAHFKDVAQAIKTDMDAYIPGTWHVIVGKAFGSFVTHENKR